MESAKGLSVTVERFQHCQFDEVMQIIKHGRWSNLKTSLLWVTLGSKPHYIFPILALSTGLIIPSSVTIFICLIYCIILFIFVFSLCIYAYGAHTENHEEFLRRYCNDSKCSAFFVAKCDGKVIGTVGLCEKPSVFPNSEYPRALWMRRMVVHEAYRRRGVARLLISACVRFAQQNSFPAVELITTFTQPGAKEMYEACGFHLVGKRFYWHYKCVPIFTYEMRCIIPDIVDTKMH